MLKEGKEVPEELVAKATAVQQNADELEKMTSTPLKESNDHAPADGATAASNFALKDKVCERVRSLSSRNNKSM